MDLSAVKLRARTGRSIPAQDKITNENTKARIKLKIGPAAITAIFASGPLSKKETPFTSGISSFSSSSSPNSPSMAQDPPSGKSFNEYRIPVFLLTQERSLGPKPTENSTTATPFNLARR